MFNLIDGNSFSDNLEDFDSIRSVLLYSDLEPEWLDDIQKNGELFYLELSEGEEEATLARVAASQCLSTNHVRFSEKEAEVITEQASAQRRGSRRKGEPALKKLARILGRKRRPSQRKGGKEGSRGKATSSPPASILKTQPGQQQGVVVLRRRLKEVCVYLNPKRLASSPTPLCERGGLLEALLGLVHRPARTGGQKDRGAGGLTVHGLIPNSPAIKCGQILIGDILLAVDDVDVSAENIERVLSCIPGPTQVKLTLETAAPEDCAAPSDSSPVQKMKASPPVSQLVRLLWGEDTAELQMAIGHIPHVVMYLSLKLDSTSPQEEEEILYQYPVSEASIQLKGVRGIFLTLCDMLENVTGGHIISSSLLLGKHLVHVGYWKEHDNLLVVGLPAERVPLLSLQTVVGDVVRTLKVMYGSLNSAFCNQDHAPRLDHFFCLFFQQLIQPWRLRRGSPPPPPPDVSGSLFLDGLPAVRWLTLPPKIKMEVDTVLSDFESSDFGEMSEDFFGLRRLYVILGSCLFYKSYLIANHLPKEDLLDVCLYCQHFCLLPLASEQRVGQLVIWREVFLQQRASGGMAPGFSQPQGRHFLLIVGLRHFMQCVLLEAGGCASPALGFPGPDCVYVDQVKATLLQLNALEPAMEERLNVPSAPCLSCADWFLPAATTRDRLASSSPVLSKLAGAIRGSPSGHRGHSLFGEKSRKSSPQRSLSDSGSEGPMDAGSGSSAAPGLSPHSTPDSGRRIGGRRDSLGSDGSGGGGNFFKMPRMKHPNPFYLGTLKKTLTDRETEEMYNTIKLTSGTENTLFHYVLMESVQGIFIAPTHREVAQLSGSIHPQLIRNFHHCCLSIRAAFQQSLPARGCRAADRSQRSGWGLGPVKEHGVLFQCKPENWTDQRKPAPTMTYWVIGRMLLEPVPQEFYVCFHDSVPEVPVEMAFRLSFGLGL
ncbi:protein inturned isoform X2 [Poeciliopsis prolifica]|uniref:protein inturned isoform X2 n=1 Tax=Poeciliopsis prolifica TaxID=188132 RepID=UPI0024143601|nr:protein inturned isoform X2 [Poeciliopsis prolifica]